MKYCKTPQKQRLLFVFAVICFCSFLLIGRLVYLMIYRADYYGKKAKAVQQRERSIKGSRGRILDRNGIVLAGNKSVSTISVMRLYQEVHTYIKKEMENYTGDHYGILIMLHGEQQNIHLTALKV